MAKHYIEVDKSDNVIRGFSDVFEGPGMDSILTNENGGRHFEINGVANPTLINIDMDGNIKYNYKYVNGSIVPNA